MSRPQIVNLVIEDLDDQSLAVENYINHLEQERDRLKKQSDERDAEAIHRLINELSDRFGYAHKGSWVIDVCDMRNYTSQLRKEAQEAE